MTFNQLRDMHREIISLVHRLAAVCERGEPTDALNEARAMVHAAIAHYLAHKEALVIAPLRESDDCAHRAMARRCALEDLEGRQLAEAHRAEWTICAIRRHPREYQKIVRQILRMIQRRAAYQEQVVFPMVREALAARAQAA
ncbi:hypothetical protein ACX40Y_11845 [Sphingomonas sp. RS6]